MFDGHFNEKDGDRNSGSVVERGKERRERPIETEGENSRESQREKEKNR